MLHVHISKDVHPAQFTVIKGLEFLHHDVIPISKRQQHSSEIGMPTFWP